MARMKAKTVDHGDTESAEKKEDGPRNTRTDAKAGEPAGCWVLGAADC